MGEAKDFMVSLIITLGLMGIFGFFIVSSLVSYDTALPQQYNQTLQLMSNTTELSGQIQEQRDDVIGRVNKTSSGFSLYDIGGFWFQEALHTGKMMFNSINIFGSLVDSGTESLSDTEFGRSFTILGFIFKSIAVIAIVMLFLAVLLKWEL